MTKPQETCAACGAPAEGNHAIHRDGFDEGPEVPLCDACGSGPTPTCDQLWTAIAVRRQAKRRSWASNPNRIDPNHPNQRRND